MTISKNWTCLVFWLGDDRAAIAYTEGFLDSAHVYYCIVIIILPWEQKMQQSFGLG